MSRACQTVNVVLKDPINSVHRGLTLHNLQNHGSCKQSFLHHELPQKASIGGLTIKLTNETLLTGMLFLIQWLCSAAVGG